MFLKNYKSIFSEMSWDKKVKLNGAKDGGKMENG